MGLREESLTNLRSVFASVQVLSESPAIWYLNAYPVNVPMASRKGRDKFWFDVTHDHYEPRQVKFYLFDCGTPEIMYVFERINFEYPIRQANLGGQTQVPNFTLFVDSNPFEFSGRAEARHEFAEFPNAFYLIPGAH